ncbi:MAG: urate hydroxylase PuuD [Gammaproteobacteria bacterium]|nr:urate hydroxylase PuuD [Gammaproteobacteria bacterium]
MESYLLQWLELILRWSHIVVGIAWIGASFYFVFLDSNLEPLQEAGEKGVIGKITSVHGGGIYQAYKYANMPSATGKKIHWFYWESYSTWLTGMALFSVLYLWNASTFLIDKQVFEWGSSWVAVLVALAFLVVFWFVYNTICRVFGFGSKADAQIALAILLVVAFASWLACQLFAGRAAFLVVGAMLATSMSANVFFWIIPGQHKLFAEIKAAGNQAPKEISIYSLRGKQRSVHNTYFTLPVVFTMLSNHYSFLYTHANAWVILFFLMLAGALIRQYFVLRHAFHHGRSTYPWSYALSGVLIVIAVILFAIPQDKAKPANQPHSVSVPQEVVSILEARCTICHGKEQQLKNIRLDSNEHIVNHAKLLYQQVVVSKTMPFNNTTSMTEDERTTIKNWFLKEFSK